MHVPRIWLLVFACTCAACSTDRPKADVTFPGTEVLRQAVMEATVNTFDKDTGECFESTMSYTLAGRRHLLPILEQCVVGPPIALVEWSDGTAFGMILLCEDKDSGRLIYLWAESSEWHLSSADNREWLRREPMVTEATEPAQLPLDAAERKSAMDLLSRLPDTGVVFPYAASAWDQWYWFTTWDGGSRRTVAVAPLGFDYVLVAEETPDIKKVGEATQLFTAYARYVMKLMYTHIKKHDPERFTDIPLPFRNYCRGGPMVPYDQWP